eukprot:COSAG01_NODE_1148_length_11519_cov_3.641944_7_plen_140_part_00
MTLAPELDGALDAIRGLREEGVTVAFGHTNASLEAGEAAMDVGGGASNNSLVTHLFNAMPPLHHREPGVRALPSRLSTVFWRGVAGVSGSPLRAPHILSRAKIWRMKRCLPHVLICGGRRLRAERSHSPVTPSVTATTS